MRELTLTPIRMALFPGQNMAGSPGFQADVAHAGRDAAPPPHPSPNSKNRRLRSGHPPKLKIAQNYPNPIYVVLFPGQNMAGSPGFQAERVGRIQTPPKGGTAPGPPFLFSPAVGVDLLLATCGSVLPGWGSNLHWRDHLSHHKIPHICTLSV